MGKTAVFVLTILNRMQELYKEGVVTCLILAHIRELALQISREFKRFSTGLNYKTQMIIGGESINDQLEEFNKNKPEIVVGTPGRLLSFIRKKKIDVSQVKIFVIDECDKMLEQLGNSINIAKQIT
jgi:ATP-dependent RNA helicase UAP56/SUB2